MVWKFMKFWGHYSALGAAVALAAASADQLFKFWMIGVLDALPVQKIVVTPFFDLVMAAESRHLLWAAEAG